MITLTKEWLLKTIAELEEERDAIPGAVNEDAARALAAMKIALASLEAEPVYQVLVDGSWTDYDKQHLEELLEAKPSTLFRVAYPSPRIMNPVSVDADDNFYSWFGREWHEHYQHNQYTTTAKQMLGVMAESAWKAGRRAAMLQGVDNEIQHKAAIHDMLCEKYNVESLADFVEWQRNHIAELEAAPPAPVGKGENAVMPDYPGYVMTQRECFQAGVKVGMERSAPVLQVWYGAMPETNGKTNWTAMLHRKGQHPWEGITIDRSEYPDRVRYEADRMRHLIGELADEPDILAYDAEAHSGYVYPGNSSVIPDGWVACSERMPERFVEVLVCTEDGSRYVAALNQSMNWDDGDFFDDIQYVTHWMPLPAAPRQEVKS
ncbi:TPA: DUF551 domain-containing protein [Enterobacter hormaechei]